MWLVLLKQMFGLFLKSLPEMLVNAWLYFSSKKTKPKCGDDK